MTVEMRRRNRVNVFRGWRAASRRVGPGQVGQNRRGRERQRRAESGEGASASYGRMVSISPNGSAAGWKLLLTGVAHRVDAHLGVVTSGRSSVRDARRGKQ